MNREIKFRAWDKLENVMWFNGFSVSAYGNIHFYEPSREYCGYSNLDWILMQYTGLKDKNGKEIYEGDICRMTWDGHEIIAPMIFNQEKAQFGLDAEVDFESPAYIKDVPTPPEIIGNIYENPELIK